jgi:hypothetical protein
MAVDPRIAATRRYLESQRDDRLKKFSWMSNQALGRAGNMSAGRRDQLMTDLTGQKTDIEESYRSQLGLQEATWKREDDLKKAQGQAATIKTIGTILGGVVGSAIPGVGTIAGITAGAGIGAGVAGLAATAITGEPDTAAMAPNELITAIQGLSSTDYIDQAMKLLGAGGGEDWIAAALKRLGMGGDSRLWTNPDASEKFKSGFKPDRPLPGR